METQNVATDASGNYSVLLGSTTATGLPGDLFSQQEQRWLGVQVQGEAEQPRVLLVSVPYAFKAHEAETLGGKSISDFVLVNGVSGANPAGSSKPSGAATANSVPATTGGGITAASQGPTNFSGSTTTQIVGVTQSGTGVGVNASAPSKALYGRATAATGTAYGIEGVATGTGGVGLLGAAISTTGGAVGVQGNSYSTSGTALWGRESATSGSTVAVLASVASPSGTAAIFDNLGGGKILSGRNNGVEKFAVDGSGNVTANGNVGNVVVDARGTNNGSSYLPGLLFGGTGSHRAIASGTGGLNPYGLPKTVPYPPSADSSRSVSTRA
jgi:trimeric autotransporter adhesin